MEVGVNITQVVLLFFLSNRKGSHITHLHTLHNLYIDIYKSLLILNGAGKNKRPQPSAYCLEAYHSSIYDILAVTSNQSVSKSATTHSKSDTAAV